MVFDVTTLTIPLAVDTEAAEEQDTVAVPDDRISQSSSLSSHLQQPQDIVAKNTLDLCVATIWEPCCGSCG